LTESFYTPEKWARCFGAAPIFLPQAFAQNVVVDVVRHKSTSGSPHDLVASIDLDGAVNRMPVRSNDFQRLVFVLKSHLVEGATVTESKLLVDRITGANREVDIYIEADVGGHMIAIAIECRGRGRPAAVGWVEEMRSKHDRLPTDRLVLVSESGFSREALRVAKLYGIETQRLEAFDEITATRMFGPEGTLWSLAVELNPEKVTLEVQVGDANTRVVALPDNYVFDSMHRRLGTVEELVRALLETHDVQQYFLTNATEEHRWFEIVWDATQATSALHLQQSQARQLHRIVEVSIQGRCDFARSELRMRSGRIGDHLIRWGTGKLLGRTARVWRLPAIGMKATIRVDLDSDRDTTPK
jgi:hypothetical protein